MLFHDFQDGRHLIAERKDFSNSEPLCRSDVSTQVSAQSDYRENFKMAALAAVLDIGTRPL